MLTWLGKDVGLKKGALKHNTQYASFINTETKPHF